LDSCGLFRTDCRIVIAKVKIKDVGPHVPAPAKAILIDGRNKWLMPGLIRIFSSHVEAVWIDGCEAFKEKDNQ
jgi:imidazolonepropionase-like amidohydrolase